MEGRPSPHGNSSQPASHLPYSQRLSTSLFDWLGSEQKILGLSRPQTLETLAAPRLTQLFASGRLEVPEWDQSGCVVSQIRQWVMDHQPDLILAVGGDGTLNLLSQVAVDQPVPVILVPAGTANDLARGLIAGTWEQLVWHQVDVISVRTPGDQADYSFVNMLALGCGARHSNDVDQQTKATWGSLAYLIQAWETLGDLEGFPLKITGDQQEHFFEDAVQLFVANGPTCGGGYRVVDSARFDDGLMDLVVINQGTPIQIASFIQSYLAGTHLEHELSVHFRCREARFQLSAPEALTLDGESSRLSEAVLTTLPNQMAIAKLEADQFL